MQSPNLPPDRLKDFPLHQMGDEILALVAQLCKVQSPIVFIAVGDGDTGEIISTANLEDSDILDLLRILLKSHEENFTAPPETMQ